MQGALLQLGWQAVGATGWCWKTGLSSGCVELAVKDAVADEIGVGAVAGVIGVIGVDAAACGIVGAV